GAVWHRLYTGSVICRLAPKLHHLFAALARGIAPRGCLLDILSRSAWLLGSSQSPVKSSGTPNTTTTRSTGPYDSNFQQHLTNYRVYPARYTHPDGKALPRPDNLDEIKQILGQPRPSLSPSQFSEGAFDAFQDADTHAAKEAQVMARVIPIIEGKLEDPKCAGGQIPFRNRDHLTDGSLVPGNLDIYYGSRPEQLRPAICNELGGHIPSTLKALMDLCQLHPGKRATTERWEREVSIAYSRTDSRIRWSSITTTRPTPSHPYTMEDSSRFLDHTSHIGAPYESETSADELSLDTREFRPIKRTKSRSLQKKA
ncbi:hypothetical protein TOPH_07872, partial [Tolypocladium ophioglossoides CBS 100239]